MPISADAIGIMFRPVGKKGVPVVPVTDREGRLETLDLDDFQAHPWPREFGLPERAHWLDTGLIQRSNLPP